MNKNTLILLALIIAAILGLTLLTQHSIKHNAMLEEAKRSERNVLQEVIDSTHNADPVFNEQLKGKTVVLTIGSPYLGVWRRQVAGLNQLVKEFNKNGKVEFIGIVPGDSSSNAKTFEKENIRLNCRVVFDKGRLLKLFMSLNKNEIKPAAFSPGEYFPIDMVINSEGKIAMIYQGDKPGIVEGIRDYLTTAVK